MIKKLFFFVEGYLTEIEIHGIKIEFYCEIDIPLLHIYVHKFDDYLTRKKNQIIFNHDTIPLIKFTLNNDNEFSAYISKGSEILKKESKEIILTKSFELIDCNKIVKKKFLAKIETSKKKKRRIFQC